MQRTFIIAVAAASLFACASNDAGFYKHSPSVAALEVPPDLTQQDVDETYAIPAISGVYTQGPLAGGKPVSMKRAGGMRWLEMQADIEHVWNRTSEFWQESKVKLAWENRQLGIMETEWVEQYDSRFAQDRFRIRFEASKDGIVRMYLTHRGRQQIVTDSGVADHWEETFSDAELEAEVTGLLLIHLGMPPESAKKVAEKGKRSQPLTEHKTDEGDNTLIVNQSYEKAWALLMQAVDRIGYIIEARDQDDGYLKLSAGSDDGGSAFNIFARSRSVYELKVETKGKQTHIIVLNEDRKLDASSDAQEFLKRIQNRI